MKIGMKMRFFAKKSINFLQEAKRFYRPEGILEENSILLEGGAWPLNP